MVCTNIALRPATFDTLPLHPPYDEVGVPGRPISPILTQSSYKQYAGSCNGRLLRGIWSKLGDPKENAQRSEFEARQITDLVQHHEQVVEPPFAQPLVTERERIRRGCWRRRGVTAV
jgi:hypothetical protein